MKPRMLIVDLHGLAEPREALNEIRGVMPPERVLVLTAIATIGFADLRAMGFRVVTRPATIGDIVAAAAELLRIQAADNPRARR